jgi:hypothetical protein
MMIKTTGAEFKRFYTDKSYWPEGTWHDDEEILVDGKEFPHENDLMTVADAAIMRVAAGCVYEAQGYEPDNWPSLEVYFRRWLREQSVVVVAVEVPKDRLQQLKDGLKEFGGKVIGN